MFVAFPRSMIIFRLNIPKNKSWKIAFLAYVCDPFAPYIKMKRLQDQKANVSNQLLGYVAGYSFQPSPPPVEYRYYARIRLHTLSSWLDF